MLSIRTDDKKQVSGRVKTAGGYQVCEVGDG